ncbi:MAG: hypothetical protein JWQ32_630 [Marmoricola sp.]|nr:hypothetical protein [Marmoricola sp.]
MVQLAWDLERLAATDDARICALFADRAERRAAIGAMVDALARTCPWSGPTGVVRLDVELAAGDVESWTIRFHSAAVRLDEAAEPRAVVSLGLVDVVRLVTGQADGALLYLAGVLDVIGDEAWVLELGRAVRAPGSTRPLIDPAALDPDAVSAAISGVPIEHLAAVMAGGFRRLVLTEVFGRFPEFLVPEKARRTRVGIGFSIGGRSDGGIDRYVVRIDAGECTVIADASGDEPVDATLLLEGHEFLRLVLGHLNPVRGVLSGQIRVHGPVIKALGFNAVMRIPGS